MAPVSKPRQRPLGDVVLVSAIEVAAVEMYGMMRPPMAPVSYPRQRPLGDAVLVAAIEVATVVLRHGAPSDGTSVVSETTPLR